MLISVVIPAYNRAHCIKRALESIRAQEIAELEVLVGDDGSTDGTPGKVLELMPEATVIRLTANRGAAAARNAVLPLARGEFIACLDSDDEWLPGKLARQIGYLREHPEVALVGTGHILACKDGTRVNFPGRNPVDWRKELHTAASFHGASTPMIRKAVLEEIGLQDERLRVLEDWDWVLRIAERFPIHVIPDTLAVIHENNPSDPDRTVESMVLFLKKHREGLLRYGKSHARRVISQHQENAARTFFRHGRPQEGCRLLWRSFLQAPLRNPAMIAAFPLASWDAVAGTQILPAVLGHRNRRPLREVS
jgi:glycosyltransferase involved in cell wall biosynthesis